jgi:hypothetical protein
VQCHRQVSQQHLAMGKGQVITTNHPSFTGGVAFPSRTFELHVSSGLELLRLLGTCYGTSHDRDSASCRRGWAGHRRVAKPPRWFALLGRVLINPPCGLYRRKRASPDDHGISVLCQQLRLIFRRKQKTASRRFFCSVSPTMYHQNPLPGRTLGTVKPRPGCVRRDWT